ncbi:MAG: acyl-CoA dehydrogenase family er 10-like, partial [Acidimicrobiia bacterium]|nr:acyl-CoA dehydrogenase family er 10-like [Acidimicrobiia bacterium]
MAWDFSTEPEFQAQLDWIDTFVREEVEPIDALFPRVDTTYDKSNELTQSLVRPLQQRVREQGLWATHLPPALGGMGYGNVKLGLINEILGRSTWAPSVFGSQAPDSGNAEVLAHYGSDAQKEKYLKPLLNGEISSTYAMTEPQAGADPGEFKTLAVRDGEEWVLNGEKWFASNFAFASFIITMVITNPDVKVHRGSSMFLVPKGTPGMELIRSVGVGKDQPGEGSHGYVRFNNCRIPAENLLGDEGAGFQIAQTRLGGGRLHHAMRSAGVCKRAIDTMAERALSRRTRGAVLADRQAVQHSIADAWIQLEQFRLQVLHAAWQCDQHGYDKARMYIAGVKVATPKTVMDITYRALHLHGALGASNEMSFVDMLLSGVVLGIADGPTEVHKDTLAKQFLKEYKPTDGLFPTTHLV